MGVSPAQRDLEDPVQVDPRGPGRHGEGEDVDRRDATGLADHVAGLEVPPEVGVLQREGTEQERQRQEEADPREVQEPEQRRSRLQAPRAWGLRRGLGLGASSRRNSPKTSATLDGKRAAGPPR